MSYVREKAAEHNVDVDSLVKKIQKYCEKQAGVELFPYQREFQSGVIESILFNDGREITCLMARQIGKCLAKGTEVLMADGEIKKVEDIKIGDKVMGPDSEPREVINTTRGKETMYEVRSRETNHESFSVNESHILSVKGRKGEIKNFSVKEYLELPEWKKKNYYRGWRVPIEYEHKEIAIDPYWLGLWLGDGRSNGISITNEDKEVIDYLKEYAEKLDMGLSVYDYEGRCNDYAITRGKKGTRNTTNILREYLKEKNLIDNKHIPDEIMVNSMETRKRFLAGLIDADGYKSKREENKNNCSFAFGNKKVAEDTLRLVRSIGLRANIKKSKTNFDTSRYRVHVYGDLTDIPTKTKRKRWENCELREDPLTFGFDLIEQGEGEYYGFTLKGKDRLFVLGDYTVTHNTETISITLGGLSVIVPKLAQMEQFKPFLGHYKNGIRIGLFAPSKEQGYTTFSRILERLTSDEAIDLLSDPEIDTEITKESNPIVLDNGSKIRLQSAAKQAKIESKTYDVIVVEEAQDIDRRKLLKSIHPTGASTNATIVKIGTAIDRRCEFYDTIQRNRRMDANSRDSSKRHYEYDYKVGQKYNPMYREYVEKEKNRYGENSDEFRMSYRLEWLLERGMFVTPQMMEDMTDNTFKHKLTCNDFCVAGIDLGKRLASTVVTVGRVRWDKAKEDEMTGDINPPIEILNWLELQGDDYESQHQEMIDFLSNYNIETLYVDSTGVGTPIADRLIYYYEGKAHVEPYDYTVPSKSELWKLLRKEIRAGRITVPSHSHTMRLRARQKWEVQMQDLVKEWRGQYLLAHKPKDDEKARDDYCFIGETPIITKNGVKNIEDVALGDLVRTHKGNWKKVKQLYQRKTDEQLIKLSTYYFGSTTMTGNHPVLTEDGFKEAKNLTMYDRIKYVFNNEEKDVTDISMKKYFESAKGDSSHWTTDTIEEGKKIKYRNPKAKWHNKMVKCDKKLFKLLGYYASEGSCGSHNIQFTINSKDREVIKEIQSLLVNVFGIPEKGVSINETKNNSTNVYTSSKVIKEFIKDIIPGTASEKKIPEFVMTAPKELQKEFIRGFFNGDGHTCKKGNGKEIGFSTVSETMAVQLRDMLLRFNIITSHHIHKRKGTKGEIRGREINNNFDLHTMRITHSKFSNRFKKLVNKENLKEKSKFHNPRAEFGSNYVLLEPIKIEKIENEGCKVFNLEVEDDNSYTVLNSTVHNCDSMSLMVKAAHSDAMPEIETTSNPFYDRSY